MSILEHKPSRYAFLAAACLMLLAACAGTTSSDPTSVSPGTQSTPESSASPSPTNEATPAPSSSDLGLPPNFDPYQNACIRLRSIAKGIWQLAPPMALSLPEDAWNQSRLVPLIIDSTLWTSIEDFGDRRVIEAKGRVAGYLDSLDALKTTARTYAKNPTQRTYRSWEDAWHVVNASATSLTFGCNA